MKTPEDEAFDELATRQGSWGGGYQAKRKAAADKLQEPPSEWEGIKAILDEYGLQAIDFVADFKAALAQPERKAQREWVDLTPEEIDEGNKQSWVSIQAWQSAVWWAAEKLKETNNG